jgi:hypothetical protein
MKTPTSDHPASLRLLILDLMFGAAVSLIALALVFSTVSCLNAPFLDGPRDKAEGALISFWSRTVACGFVLWILVILRNRLRRRKSAEPEL